MYVQILQKEFVKRSSANASYSIRAFARDLKLSPSFFASILKKEKGISQNTALKIANLLKLSQTDKKIFLLSSAAQCARKISERNTAQNELDHFLESQKYTKFLSLEEFESISSWEFLATLALFETQNFTCTENSLSERLQISPQTSLQVLNKLEELTYITRQEDGAYKSNVVAMQTPSEIPSRVIQNYHRNILNKAEQSLSLPLKDREFFALTFAARHQDSPEMKEFIRDFQEKFSKKFTCDRSKNSIFQLSVQLFRMDKGDQ